MTVAIAQGVLTVGAIGVVVVCAVSRLFLIGGVRADSVAAVVYAVDDFLVAGVVKVVEKYAVAWCAQVANSHRKYCNCFSMVMNRPATTTVPFARESIHRIKSTFDPFRSILAKPATDS